MAHTRPDYSTKQKMATIYGDVDNAELAARLNSPITFDRRGNIVFYEDFTSALLQWGTASGGVGAAWNIDATTSLINGTSLKITVGSGAGTNTSISRMFSILPFKRIGFEAAFTMHAGLDEFEINLRAYDGTNYFAGRAAVDRANTRVEINDDAGANVDLASPVGTYSNVRLFHVLKLVVDLQTSSYVRVIYDNNEYDASAYGLQTVASGNDPYILWTLLYRTSAAATRDVNIDRLILTQNEP